jgi:hypothetical protein
MCLQELIWNHKELHEKSIKNRMRGGNKSYKS